MTVCCFSHSLGPSHIFTMPSIGTFSAELTTPSSLSFLQIEYPLSKILGTRSVEFSTCGVVSIPRIIVVRLFIPLDLIVGIARIDGWDPS